MTSGFSSRVVAVCLAVVLLVAAMARGSTDIIALEGDIPPEGHGLFSRFFPPALNDAGQTVFTAVLDSTPSESDRGIYRGGTDSGELTLVAREAPATQFDSGIESVGSAVINANGQVAFWATYQLPLSAGGGTVKRLYRWSGGSPVPIVSEHDPAPDGNGFFDYFEGPSLNDSGQVSFGGWLTGTNAGSDDNTGVFLASGDTVTQIARSRPSGIRDSGFEIGSPRAINAVGDVVFKAKFIQPHIAGGASYRSIYRGSEDSITAVAVEGDPNPSGDGVLIPVFPPTLNDSGQVAFTALEEIGGWDAGIYRGSGDLLTEIVGRGDPAPGGGHFSHFPDYVALNNSGEVAFRSFMNDISHPYGYGIFLGSGGELKQIARSGTLLPDGSGIFVGFDEHLAINDRGQVLFYAELDGLFERGIFLGNGIDIIEVGRTGQQVDGHAIRLLGFETGEPYSGNEKNGLNIDGQVAFLAEFESGQQAILRYTIPLAIWVSQFSNTLFAVTENWSGGVVPNSFHDAVIDPLSYAVVVGNAEDEYVNSLTIGNATLRIDNGGDFTALEEITIKDRGKIAVGRRHVVTSPLLSNRGVLTGDGMVAAQLRNHATGQVLVENGERLEIVSDQPHQNDGAIESLGGAVEFTGLVTNTAYIEVSQNATFRFHDGLTNQGTFSVDGGSDRVFGDVDNQGHIAVAGGADVVFYGDVVNQQQVSVFSNSTATFESELSGHGVSGRGTVYLEGGIQPGLSEGEMVFGGDVHFGTNASLEIELAGPLAGSQHDRLSVAGDLSLDGILHVQPISPYADPSHPGEVDSFTLIIATAIDGVFDHITYDGVFLEETVSTPTEIRSYIDDGLFRILRHQSTQITFLNYRALPGDANGDLRVDVSDFNIWNANKFSSGTDWITGDFNGDGNTDVSDFNIWNAKKFTSADRVATVPEPNGCLVFCIAVIWMLCWRDTE